MASILQQLSEAVRSQDDTQLTQLLARNPGININGVIPRTKGGRLIHLAALKPAALTPLLTHPLIDVNLKNNSGETAFFIASRAGVTDTVQMLLRCERIDVLAANAKGQTPLWVLAKEGRYKLVKQVLDLAGDELSQGDLQAAVVVAKQLNRRRVVEYLERERGIQEINTFFIAQTEAGVSVLDHYNRILTHLNLPPGRSLTECKKRYQESGRIINIYDYVAWVQELLHNPDAQLRTFTWEGFLSDITNNRSRIFPLQRAKEKNLKLLLVQWSGRR